MPMARKRANKNLIAFLTIMGMVLSVAIVAIITYQSARKDPEVYAQSAREAEEAGDLARAIQLYNRAFAASGGATGGERDADYLIEAARCAYEIGEIGTALSMLDKGSDEQPNNEKLVVSYLELLWNYREKSRLPATAYSRMREFAERLIEIDPDNVLGPLSQAVSLLGIAGRDDETMATAEQAMARAVELDPHAPRVALTQVEWELEQTGQRWREMWRRGAQDADFDRLNREFLQKKIEIIEGALAQHPNHPDLVRECAAAYGQLEQEERALELLRAALDAHPENADLHLAAALRLIDSITRRGEDWSAERFEQEIDRARRYAAKAAELEPALYGAYVAQADLELIVSRGPGGGSTPPEAYERAVEIYRAAIDETVGLRSLRATLSQPDRMRMFIGAFKTARTCFDRAEANSPWREKAIGWMRSFLEDVEKRYPEEALTYYLRGLVYQAEGETSDAIRAFEVAEEKGRADPMRRFPALWARLFNRLATEQLAYLYRQLGQPGVALDNAEQAVEAYAEQLRQEPPLFLQLTRGELLITLDRAQEALDVVLSLMPRYPGNRGLLLLKANALEALGREEEARTAYAGIEGDDPPALMLQAQRALTDDDFDRARDILTRVLRAPNLSSKVLRESLRAYSIVMAELEQAEEGARVLREIQSKADSDDVKRLIEGYIVWLSTDDPAQREREILQRISELPDPAAREREYVLFYNLRQDYDKVRPHLNRLEELQPDDHFVLEQQFLLALRQEDLSRAREYLVRLAEENVDGAGGATYRGIYELQAGDPEEAIREFELAERELPKSSLLKFRQARAMIAANRLEDAADALREAVEINPRDFSSYKALYGVLDALGRTAEAVEALRTATELNPTDPFIRERAALLEEEENPQAGIERREARRADAPDDIDNLLRLAHLYEKVGKPSRAAEVYEAATRAAPDNLAAVRAASAFYMEQSQRAPGERILKAYIDAQGGLSRVTGQILLGRFLEGIGAGSDAEAAYKQADRMIDSVEGAADAKRRAKIQVGFELIGYYRRAAGQDPSVVEACQWVLDQLRPDNPGDVDDIQRARLTLIDALFRLERLGEASDEIDTYIEAFPDDLRGQVQQARLYLAKQDLTESSRALTRILQNDADHIWALYERGRIALRRGRYTDARDDLERAKALLREVSDTAPEAALRTPLREQLARLYEVTDQFELAESELRETLEYLVTNRPDAQMAQQEAAGRLLELYRSAGRLDRAQQIVSENMARFPENAYWPYQLGQLLTERGEHAAAVGYFETAERLVGETNPRFRAICMSLRLQAMTKGGRVSEAIRVFEQQPDRGIPAIVRIAAARAYRQANREDQAQQQLELSLAAGAQEGFMTLHEVVSRARGVFSPENIETQIRRVAGGYEAGTRERAYVDVLLAMFLLDHEKPQEALDVLSSALGYLPEKSAIWLEGVLARARGQEALGQVDEAVRTLEGVLEKMPDAVPAINNLAYLLAENAGRPESAVRYAERARALEPGNASVLDTVGWVYYRNGQMEEAEAALQEALSIEPDNVAANYHLGVIHEDRGQRTQARNFYRRARESAERSGRSDSTYAREASAALDRLR